MSISGHTSYTIHSFPVQHQNHKSFVRHVPFTTDSESAGLFKAESGIIFRIADYNYMLPAAGRRPACGPDVFQKYSAVVLFELWTSSVAGNKATI
jgi:hypothetical protein